MWYIVFDVEYLLRSSAPDPSRPFYARSIFLGVKNIEARGDAEQAARLKWQEEKNNDPTLKNPRLVWQENLDLK